MCRGAHCAFCAAAAFWPVSARECELSARGSASRLLINNLKLSHISTVHTFCASCKGWGASGAPCLKWYCWWCVLTGHYNCLDTADAPTRCAYPSKVVSWCALGKKVTHAAAVTVKRVCLRMVASSLPQVELAHMA